MSRLLVTLACALVAAPALGQTFPARSGESGLLDVPDADTLGVGVGSLASELRMDGGRGDARFGPLPVYATAGMGRNLELGLSMRDGGQAGDPAQGRMLFGAAAKLRLIDGSRALVSLALDGYADRLGYREVGGGRFLLSSSANRPVRVASFVGYELGKADGLTYGLAVSLAATRTTTVVLEGLDGPRGANVGVALWQRIWPGVPVSLGFNRLIDDGAYRITLGIAFSPARRMVQPEPESRPAAAASEEAVASAAQPFIDERPHFRLKLRPPAALSTEPRSLRHGPWTPSLAAAGSRMPVPTAPGLRGAAPSLEDLADAQLREQEALAEARERRVRTTGEQLEGRDRSAQDEARRLADRERELAAREQQLDARERRLGRPGGAPNPQVRELESLEAQIASQERNLGAQERSLGAAIDAAQGRERDAGAREDAERGEASRLAASVSGAGSRAQQNDVRKQALGARNRQLAALEARLVARGERIDALERQLRTRSERLDGWQRRLDTRSERLDLLEKRAADPKAATLAPPTLGAGKAAAAVKDKAIFVMVVKSPTAIVKERGGAPASPVAPGAIQPGTAVEKAVAAATVVTFATPAAQLSELDRETIDNIAKLAAREGCELLIWARAKDPGLMSEAQRRAAEIRSRVMQVAQLPDRQVVTRITTRPGAQGVDVVISALRETAKPSTAPVAPATGARPAGQLESGEAGKRQIREAVQAAQPTIEACVGELMEQKKLPRAEGSLKLTLSAAGKVVKVLAGDGDLSGAGLGECLSAASTGWTFPPADGEYVVEVPITVIRGGAR